MLTQLTINHFAIVHHLDIEFQKGMSVITGETGAGKSIAIDALGVCLGQRAESSMLREGEARADICAVFQISQTSPAFQWLKEQALQDLDNPENCILRRVIHAEGRTKAFINDTPVSVSQLKTLAKFLIQINGQHAAQGLLKSDNQLKLLDHFCENHDLLKRVQNNYRYWKDLQYQVATFQQKCAENEAKKQLLSYQVEELDLFDLKENEYLELEEEHTKLSNSETLRECSQQALNYLSENEQANADNLLYRASQCITELTELDSRYQDIQNLLQEALIQVQEATSEMQYLATNIEQDPYKLQDIETRMGQALSLARKHNIRPQELVQLHQTLKQELNALVDFSASENELIAQEQMAYQSLKQSAEALHQARLLGAQNLSEQVTQTIHQLAMENAEFSIVLDTDYDKITPQGADRTCFHLRGNLGQSPQPLAKVASGGELSRIALALQVLTSDKSAIPTLIFDEIDVGISGATASVVGKLLRKLGKQCQVICVTHLPQVACFGDNHFSVKKQIINEKTETNMKILSQEQRVKALAKLLGGEQITNSALINAQEMLDLAS